MKRRTFLGWVAAVVGGVLTCRPSSGLATKAKWKPPPRWEWEAGEWRHAPYRLPSCQKATGWLDGVVPYPAYGEATVRTWEGVATILVFSEEWEVIHNAMRACNETAFIGTPSGHIHVESMKSQYIGNGLAECHVRLCEIAIDPWQITSLQTVKLVDFYDVFRGGHAVVSVGGKAVV